MTTSTKFFTKWFSYTVNLFLPSTYRFPLVSSTGWHKDIRVVLQTLADDSCCHDNTRGGFSGQYRDVPRSGVEPTELLCQVKRGTVVFLKIMCNFINKQSSQFIKIKGQKKHRKQNYSTVRRWFLFEIQSWLHYNKKMIFQHESHLLLRNTSSLARRKFAQTAGT